MTLPIFKSGEPLYTIIVREQEAQQRLNRWSKSSRSIQARVEDNRLHLFDHNSLCLFVITWEHSWDTVMVWDTFLKRHIYF